MERVLAPLKFMDILELNEAFLKYLLYCLCQKLNALNLYFSSKLAGHSYMDTNKIHKIQISGEQPVIIHSNSSDH